MHTIQNTNCTAHNTQYTIHNPQQKKTTFLFIFNMNVLKVKS